MKNMYSFNVEIKDINYWYRESTKEWVVEAEFRTDNVWGSVRYSNKKLNKAKRRCFKNLHEAICGSEIDYAFENHLLNFNKKDK